MKFDSDKKRNILGELMFNRISSENISNEYVSKITGMLIDLDILELDEILEML